MSQPFQTGCTNIDLTGSPWNIVGSPICVYVLNQGGLLSLWTDSGCAQAFSPPNFNIPEEQSTGLYFYIAAGSDEGTRFPDGTEDTPLPVKWDVACPSTVTYGKIMANGSAFSMSDFYDHKSDLSYGFDIVVTLPDLTHHGISIVAGIDPMIIEAGEVPPP
jgi:hypothetical protein